MSRRNGMGARRGRKTQEEKVKEYDAFIRYASAIVLLAAGVLLALALFGAAGPVGAVVFATSYAIVGIGAFILPLALIAVGLYAGFGRPTIDALTASGALLTVASVLAFAGLFPDSGLGGKIGAWEGGLLAGFFGFWGALVLLIATVAIGVAIVADLEALGALLGENVLLLWERLRRGGRREATYDEEFTDVVGVPEEDEEDEDN